MKKIINAVVILVLSLNYAVAQETQSSLLWKVEGKGIQPSFVFGTFHIIPQDDFEFKDKVKNAINETELTILELDMDDPQLLVEMQKLAQLNEGETLSSYMDDNEYRILDTYLKKKMGVGMTAFNNVTPMTVTSLITITLIGKKTISYEGEIIKQTKEEQKEILGLETAGDQKRIFDIEPYEKQIDDIIEYLNNIEKTRKEFDVMIDLYKKEDIEGLYSILEETFDENLKFKQAMLDNRNSNWITKIKEFSSNKEVFYGVGAGHLGGEQGVINLLRKEGYTVTPVLD